MTPLLIAAAVFACVFSAALMGLALHARLPAHHLDATSTEVVKLVMGLIATVAALVLSLLIASAYGSFDRQESEMQQLSAYMMQVDTLLARYGPETWESRDLLRQFVAQEIQRLWPSDHVASTDLEHTPATIEGFALYDKIISLSPQTEAQRIAQSRAAQALVDMAHLRRLMHTQTGGSLSWPFFVVLVFWLVVLFSGFGLLARANATVVAALFVGAVTVAGAIFLLLEMNAPYSGLMAISSAPMRNTLAVIGR
jgi:hypothetical protein